MPFCHSNKDVRREHMCGFAKRIKILHVEGAVLVPTILLAVSRETSV